MCPPTKLLRNRSSKLLIWTSPSGEITLEYNAKAVTRIAWGGFGFDYLESVEDVPPHVEQCVAQLREYFAGTRRLFTFPMEPDGGTPFQRQVWQKLIAIPYGSTMAYGALLPGKARAVAQACHANPLAIVVPCHRVIAANGTIHGYAYGRPLKQYLLTLEASHLTAAAHAN